MCEKRAVSDACRNVSRFCLTVKDGRAELPQSHMYFYQVQTQLHVTGLPWCDFCVWSPIGDPFVQRITYNKEFMDKVLVKAQKFYFDKFLPAITPYLVIPSRECCTFPQSSLTKETREHLPNLEKTTKCNVKSDPDMSLVKHTPCTAAQQDYIMQDSGTEYRVPVKNSPCQKAKQSTDCDDVQFVVAYSKPSLVQTCKSLLLHLKLKKHCVKGDGNCLYHAVAHQARLIPSSSSGDELVCRHLRQLTLLTMLNYPAVQSEGFIPQGEWMEKQQTILRDSEWGGDLEIRLMAIGLKKEIIVITDSAVGNAFARQYPCQPPPIPVMKGGLFVPLSGDELCVRYDSLHHNSLVILYNGSNHFDSTRPL